MKIMTMIVLSSLFLLPIASLVSAEEIPEVIFGHYTKKQPSCFTDSSEKGYSCEGFVFDTIAIERRNKETAFVGITLKFQNAHGCAFYGIGRWKNGNLVAIEKNSSTKDICRVEVSIIGNSASFKGIDDACSSPSFCSARGSLAGSTGFNKRARKDK